jgi:hypothetical protein
MVCLAIKTDRNASEVDYFEDRESFTLWVKADDEIIRCKPKRFRLCMYHWVEANNL